MELLFLLVGLCRRESGGCPECYREQMWKVEIDFFWQRELFELAFKDEFDVFVREGIYG